MINVPLKKIAELAKSRTPEQLIKLLSQYAGRIIDNIQYLKEAHSAINTYRGLLCEGISATEEEITVSEMPEKRIIMGNLNDFNGTVGFFGEYTRFCSIAHEPNINLSFPVGGYFENMDTFLKDPSRPERFFSIDPLGNHLRKRGDYLIGFARGYYAELGDTPERMKRYIDENSIKVSGPVYIMYLFDETCTQDPSNYLAQIAVAASR